MRLKGAARTHQGLHRAKNEDAFHVSDELGLFAVADGMGGAARGEVASRMVIEAITDYIRRFVEEAITDPERYDYYDSNISPRANTLLQAIHLANRLVYDIAQADSRHRRHGRHPGRRDAGRGRRPGGPCGRQPGVSVPGRPVRPTDGRPSPDPRPEAAGA